METGHENIKTQAQEELDFVIDTMEDFTRRGNKIVADHYVRQNSVYKDYKEGVRFPVCSTESKELNKFGLGIELYFDWVKWLIITFAILSFIDIGKLAINWQGKNYNEEEAGLFERFTLGNLDTGKKEIEF